MLGLLKSKAQKLGKAFMVVRLEMGSSDPERETKRDEYFCVAKCDQSDLS